MTGRYDQRPERDLLFAGDEVDLAPGAPEWFVELADEDLDPDRRRVLETKLAADPDLERAFESYRRTVQGLRALGASERRRGADARLRARILEATRRPRLSPLPLLASASLAAALLLAVIWAGRERRPQTPAAGAGEAGRVAVLEPLEESRPEAPEHELPAQDAGRAPGRFGATKRARTAQRAREIGRASRARRPAALGKTPGGANEAVRGWTGAPAGGEASAGPKTPGARVVKELGEADRFRGTPPPEPRAKPTGLAERRTVPEGGAAAGLERSVGLSSTTAVDLYYPPARRPELLRILAPVAVGAGDRPPPREVFGPVVAAKRMAAGETIVVAGTDEQLETLLVRLGREGFKWQVALVAGAPVYASQGWLPQRGLAAWGRSTEGFAGPAAGAAGREAEARDRRGRAKRAAPVPPAGRLARKAQRPVPAEKAKTASRPGAPRPKRPKRFLVLRLLPLREEQPKRGPGSRPGRR